LAWKYERAMLTSAGSPFLRVLHPFCYTVARTKAALGAIHHCQDSNQFCEI